MPKATEIHVRTGIKSPILKIVHRKLVEDICAKVVKIVAEETSCALEAMEQVVEEEAAKGGAK